MKKKDNHQNKVIVETVIDDQLPPGWVKEIRIKKLSNGGVRRDPFYNDTTTGYVFRSRLEVFRYLETGEISKHAYKRKDSGRNIIQSMQGTPSAATVGSNNNKGKGTLEGSLLPNHGNSKVAETGSDIVSAGNNVLLDLGTNVDVVPIEPQKPEGNENDVVHMDNDPKISKRKLKRNEMASSRRSSNRLAGIETEFVTHSVAIERVIRAANKNSTKGETVPCSEPNQANQSQQAPQSNNVGSQEDTLRHTESATVPSKNEIVGAEQIKINEECGVRSSKRKPERNRKKIVLRRQSSNLLAEDEAKPVTHTMTTQRVLRSASSKSAKPEDVPSYGPKQGEQVKDVPPIVNAGLQEEIVCQYVESATTPVKNELLVAERIEDNEECEKRRPRSRERKPKRNRKEIVSPITHATQRVLRSASSKSAKTEDVPSLRSDQDKQKEAPLVINSQEIVPAPSILSQEQAAKATSSSNVTDQTVSGNCMVVEPSRNKVEVEMIKETPKNNSKEDLCITDELTAVIESIGKEKEQQDSHFSFPWSDPCIEFAYKTLTGVLPLDDTLAIHDYIQHQIRTSSHNTKDFTASDCRPSSFSPNTVPSNSSTSITFPDPGPPGFSRGGNNLTLVDARPPGFSLNDVPSMNGNDLTLPDSGPPGFSRGSVPLNSGNNLAIPDGMPPGFSQSSIPPNSSNNFALPDSRPPRFSWSAVPPNSINYPTVQDAKPPGFPWGNVPLNRVDNPAVPDAKPPGFPWGNVPLNRVDNPAVPDAKPPGFPWGSVPPNSVDNPAVPDAKPPGFPWGSVPPNSVNNLALQDAKPSGPPGFPWSSAPSNSGNNPALPDAKPPGFSWSCIPPNSDIGINLNVALPDSGPPGFSQKIHPSSKQQQHQQQINPEGLGTQPADIPFQGTMFTWNHRS